MSFAPRPCLLSLLALMVAFVAPTAAHAAKPKPKVIIEDHRHNSGGSDWHVQLEANNKGSRLASVVVYSQTCGETGFMQSLPLTSDGSFEVVDRPLENKKGTWSVAGSFIYGDRASGTWSVTKGDCTQSGTFTAQDKQGHFLIGNPYEYPTEKIRGNSLNARKLRSLQYRSRQTAPRFDTLPEIERLGYVLSTKTGCPGLHHARKRGTTMWGGLLDPGTPQSLVFWCDSDMNWTLAGYMYRASGQGKRPPTYDNMMQWHRHSSSKTATWMTHVWMVGDPVAALATCAPFPAFAASGLFNYEPYVIDARVDTPCSDFASAAKPESTG